MAESATYGDVRPHGRNLMDDIQFKQRQPWGRKGQSREVSVAVPKEMLLGIAKYLAAGCVAGHAVWHYENPTRTFPCPGDDDCCHGEKR